MRYAQTKNQKHLNIKASIFYDRLSSIGRCCKGSAWSVERHGDHHHVCQRRHIGPRPGQDRLCRKPGADPEHCPVFGQRYQGKARQLCDKIFEQHFYQKISK